MKPISVVPTLCTLGNAFCGFLAIAKGADAVAALTITEGPLDAAHIERFHDLISAGCWFVFLAMVFDALDGRLARLTQQSSDFGAMLDSLVDMLTFGAAPALLLKFLFESTRRIHEQPVQPKVVLLLTVLYVCCAALRLARFTIETEGEEDSHDFFRGLPTPAAAGFLAAAMLFYCDSASPSQITAAIPVQVRGYFLGAILLATPALGLLMISKQPYVHMVNRYMRGRRPYTYVAQVVFVLFLLAIFWIWALFLAFLAYVALCPVWRRIELMREKKSEQVSPPER